MPSPQLNSLKARVVVPMDRPAIDGGVVTIAGERIVEVSTRPPAGATVEDLGDVALLPGLINAHTHLEFSHLAQPLGAPGMNFVEWIRLVIARRTAASVSPREAVAQGLGESLRAGVTTICDITTHDASVYAEGGDAPDVVALLEVIGFSQARVESALAAAEDRMRASRTAADSGERLLGVGWCPHAPYTVNLKLLGRLCSLARRDALPVAIHLAESREELELLFSGSGMFRELLEERGMWDKDALKHRGRPFDYQVMLMMAPRALVVHGTHLSRVEVTWLAQMRKTTSLVYCPRTHAYFNRRPYPLWNFLKEGVRVVLGTDSRASTPDLSILQEARYAAAQHANVIPHQILQMATLHAAESLGTDDRTGSLTPGKLANLTAVPVSIGSHVTPAEAILTSNAPPVATWHRGRRYPEVGC